MIQKPRRTASDRRILSFPAVHPCEGISPSTLLSSLVSLSNEIRRFQPGHEALPLSTQRRNAREAIRIVSLLLVFFEEVLEDSVDLSDSAILCFSELHLALQKLRFLLEDLWREGSRVWILTKSELVASQFRSLSRAIATALDILPLGSIGVCTEVVEIIELVAKQCRRAKFELDRDDQRYAHQVFVILSSLGRRIEPRLSSVKRVLNYLGIRTWSDCNKEVKFLEEEIEFEASDCEKQEIPLLSGLLGLMTYSRAVIFQEFDYRSREPVVNRTTTSTTEALRCLNPEDFRCPISLEIMTNPVTVSTGQTYDQSSIQKWLSSGNTTCPKTGEKLSNNELVSNCALRRLIRNILAENGVSTTKPGRKHPDIAAPGSRSAAEAMKFAAAFVVQQLVFGPREAKSKAAYEIRLLAKWSGFNRTCLIDAGAILPLIHLLSSAATSSGETADVAAEENAAAALLKLSKHGSGRILIVESGGVGPMVEVLANGLSAESRQIAAAALFYLAMASPEHRKVIGDSPRAIPALAELMRTGTACGKKNAAVAIFALSFHPDNVPRVLRAGTVPLLVNALTISDRTDLVNDTLAVLSTLAESPDGSKDIAVQSSSLSSIKVILQTSNSRASKEYCVSILLSLCNNVGSNVVTVLAKDQSLMGLLYSVITDGTSAASKKARCLIKILHKFRETTSSSGGVVGLSSQEQYSSVRAW